MLAGEPHMFARMVQPVALFVRVFVVRTNNRMDVLNESLKIYQGVSAILRHLICRHPHLDQD